MQKELDILKGIHPGLVLDRELKKRQLSKGRFAISVNEFPQTISAIINGKRSMNTSLALRIEEALEIEEGFFMTLQVFYDIREEKRERQSGNHPQLSMLRPVLFWDTDISKIDWQKQKAAVIQRIFERGNELEKQEITRFYGQDIIDGIMHHKKVS